MSETTTKQLQTTTSKVKTRTIAFVGLMGAMSSILMLFRFPIPFLPPFLSFDLAGVPEILGGYMFGPLAALCIIVVKIALQLIMQGSHSLGTGELQNLILSCTYVLPALIIYHRKKTKKTAILGLTCSTLLVSAVAVLTNLYMIIPFYAKLMGSTIDDFVAMCTAVNPAIDSVFKMALIGILPFNLLKYGVTSIVTFILYKRMSKFIKSLIQK